MRTHLLLFTLLAATVLIVVGVIRAQSDGFEPFTGNLVIVSDPQTAFELEKIPESQIPARVEEEPAEEPEPPPRPLQGKNVFVYLEGKGQCYPIHDLRYDPQTKEFLQ